MTSADIRKYAPKKSEGTHEIEWGTDQDLSEAQFEMLREIAAQLAERNEKIDLVESTLQLALKHGHLEVRIQTAERAVIRLKTEREKFIKIMDRDEALKRAAENTIHRLQEENATKDAAAAEFIRQNRVMDEEVNRLRAAYDERSYQGDPS